MAKVIQTMWAVGWHQYEDESSPQVLDKGPWLLCYTKEMAEARKRWDDQEVKRVRVTVECAKGRKCKARDN